MTIIFINHKTSAFIQEPVVKTESILVVEDDYIVAKVIDESLKSLGYAVAGMVATGEEAIATAESEKPDLVLMDIRLQGEMDGISASEKIQAAFDIPVIFLTAFSDKKTFERALVTAPYGYVIKPFSINTLSTSIKVALYKHSLDQKLNESEAKYRAIIENIQDMFYRTDLQGNLTMISPSGIKLAGYSSADELIGHNLAHDLIVNQEDSRQFSLALKQKGSVDQYPLVIRDRQGSLHHVTASSHLCYDSNGEVIGVEGILHDFTDRKKAEDALRQVNRQLSLLSGITRHDILNKITVILGYLSLAETTSTDPVLSDYFRKMNSATIAIKSQIEFTRIYQDVGTTEPQWQDLENIVSQLSVPAIISLNSDIQGIEFYADTMLEKVFFNLLDNSIRHGQHVTEISVSSNQSGDGLTVVWEDNGVGVAADQKEKIFERGFGKNTGLGLFLVRDILSLTGINIKETGTEGTGARFEIYVPPGVFRLSRVS
jgi:PAS domain S-box-containing protein